MCGLVGLKVTRDRNPHLPDGYDFAQGYVVEHVMTRTVRDCAAMLDVTGVPEPGAPYAPPAKDRPYMEEIETLARAAAIAWSSETANGRPIQPEIRPRWKEIADLLASSAMRWSRAGWGSTSAPSMAPRTPSGANFAAGMRRLIDRIGREPEADELEPLTWASLKGGRKPTGEEAMWRNRSCACWGMASRNCSRPSTST